MQVLFNQYKAIKAKYPDALLLFRVGDCYESFGGDATILSQRLGLTLTKTSDEALNVMSDFPFHTLDSHLRTLVKAGYRVAICEQLEDPKKAKGMMKRGVTDYFEP